MENLKLLFAFLLLGITFPVWAQTDKSDCEDVVYIKGGSVLRGTIIEYIMDSTLVMTSWSGARLQVPTSTVKKIVQRCKDNNKSSIPFQQRPYTFKETGWYHATRFVILAGETATGIGFQHSSGFKINRYVGVGFGVGLENFGSYDAVPATYPIFVELRGYLLSKKITPFYAIAAGTGLTQEYKENSTWNGGSERWKGGWMAQGQVGYRIGNNAFVQLGIRLQHRKRIWIDDWWGYRGTDYILHKRLEIGLGLLL